MMGPADWDFAHPVEAILSAHASSSAALSGAVGCDGDGIFTKMFAGLPKAAVIKMRNRTSQVLQRRGLHAHKTVVRKARRAKPPGAAPSPDPPSILHIARRSLTCTCRMPGTHTARTDSRGRRRRPIKDPLSPNDAASPRARSAAQRLSAATHALLAARSALTFSYSRFVMAYSDAFWLSPCSSASSKISTRSFESAMSCTSASLAARVSAICQL